MADSLLTQNQKSRICAAIKKKRFREVIAILESIKTAHAGTAKTKDKRFVLKEITRALEQEGDSAKAFLKAGSAICNLRADVAKQIGVGLVWRGYSYSKQKTERVLLAVADHQNWEVRESAAGAFAETVNGHAAFYNTLKKWSKHKSVNVRRAVVLGAIGLRRKDDAKGALKALTLLEPLLYDEAPYIKKNLGPFVLGSYFGRSHPEVLFRQLKRWAKIDNEHVRWNIAMAFNNSTGNQHPEKALELLACLVDDERRTVRRAVISTLRFLRKRNLSLVENFCKPLCLYI